MRVYLLATETFMTNPLVLAVLWAAALALTVLFDRFPPDGHA